MFKKFLLSFQTLLVIAAVIFASCAVPTNESEAALENSSAIEQAMIEKNGDSRLGSWQLVDNSVSNGRDIGAYKDVYVISEDGKTIYVKEEDQSSFSPVPFTHQDLNNYPADKIGVGASKAIASYRSFRGMAIKAKYSNIYAYITYPGSKKLELLPKVGWRSSVQDIAVSAEGDIYVGIYSQSGHMVKKFNWSTWEWEKLVTSANHTSKILSIDVNTTHRYGYYEQYGITMLSEDKNVYDIEKDIYNGNEYHVIDKYTVTPTKEIAADQRPGMHYESYATFNNNTPTVYYVNQQAKTAVSLGNCKHIAISYDGYLWDAYTGGIWKRQL